MLANHQLYDTQLYVLCQYAEKVATMTLLNVLSVLMLIAISILNVLRSIQYRLKNLQKILLLLKVVGLEEAITLLQAGQSMSSHMQKKASSGIVSGFLLASQW